GSVEYRISAHGTSSGIAVVLGRTHRSGGFSAGTLLVRIDLSGTLSTVTVGATDTFVPTFADFDGTGAGFLSVGGSGFSGLQKFSSGPVWPGSGFVYP